MFMCYFLCKHSTPIPFIHLVNDYVRNLVISWCRELELGPEPSRMGTSSPVCSQRLPQYAFLFDFHLVLVHLSLLRTYNCSHILKGVFPKVVGEGQSSRNNPTCTKKVGEREWDQERQSIKIQEAMDQANHSSYITHDSKLW